MKLGVVLTTFGLPKGKSRAQFKTTSQLPPASPTGAWPQAQPSVSLTTADPPLPSRGETHVQLAGIWNHLLEEHLLVIALTKRPCVGERRKQVESQGPELAGPTLAPHISLPMSVPALQPPCPSTESRARILKEANGVEPGCVEIIPRNRVTVHVRTWLSAQTGRGGRKNEGGWRERTLSWSHPSAPPPQSQYLR